MVQRDRNRESVRKTHDNVKARNKKNSLYKYPRTDYAPRLIKKTFQYTRNRTHGHACTHITHTNARVRTQTKNKIYAYNHRNATGNTDDKIIN